MKEELPLAGRRWVWVLLVLLVVVVIGGIVYSVPTGYDRNASGTIPSNNYTQPETVAPDSAAPGTADTGVYAPGVAPAEPPPGSAADAAPAGPPQQ